VGVASRRRPDLAHRILDSWWPGSPRRLWYSRCWAMSTELRSLAAAMVAHQFAGARPLDAADSYQRARFMVAGVVFGVYYRGSSYVFSWFAKKGTSALTSEPTTALVTEGPYAVSRNPALLLVWVFHVACAVAFNSWWPLLVALPLTYAYLTLITVPNEEEELEKLFGRQYRDYKQQTPRFLIPHSCALLLASAGSPFRSVSCVLCAQSTCPLRAVRSTSTCLHR
jgi:protein-S-isoprenylcysteine O-methyltransferase Ste14